jgi:hypothetical protein
MLKRGVETLPEILGSDALGTRPHSPDLFSSNAPVAARRHETYRLESADGLSLPSVIVPASGDVEDFFATVATYYQEQSPLSAVVHVLGDETAGLLVWQSKRSGIPTAGHRSSSRLAGIGAAIGEATLAGVEARDPSSSISYAACRRTLGFSLFRAMFLYDTVLRPDVLAERWIRLRKLTGLSVSTDSTDAILLAHALAFGGADPSKSPQIDAGLGQAISVLVKDDDGDDELLVRTVVGLYPATKQYFDDLRGAFDGRMAAFTRLVDAIQTGSRGVRTDEIAVAFACNRIFPGSFAHAGVLGKLVSVFPAALIWYGVLAAISRPSASQQLSPSLLSKLERDLLDSFTFEQRPRCDISLEELEVLSRTPLRAETVKPSQQRVLLVALLPGVDTYTRFGLEGDVVGERVRRDVEADELYRRVSRLLEEALYALRKSATLSREPTTTSVNRRQRKDR